MKELSIEEKAKCYDSIIERLKDFQFQYRFSPFSDVIEENFPELKESEDPKMCNTRECIAWGVDIAHHFAEWQKQQMKEALQTEYEKGRFDMREEMMKDAVDGEYWDGSIYLDNRPTEYKDGYKMKIIIVKEEQQ